MDKRDKWFKHTVNGYITARVFDVLISWMEVWYTRQEASYFAFPTKVVADLESTMATLITASLVYVEDEQGNLGFLYIPYSFFVVYFVVMLVGVPCLACMLVSGEGAIACPAAVGFVLSAFLFWVPIYGMLLDYYPSGTKNVLDQFQPVTNGIDDWEMDTDNLKQLEVLPVIETIWDFLKPFLSACSSAAAA